MWLELVLDSGIPYHEYIKQPYWLIEAHIERFYAKGGK